MADEAQDVDAGRIKDVGQAQRVAYAEKAARETEAAVKVEQEGKIQDPIPVVVDVLKKALGPKDNDTDFNHRVTSLHSYAREVKDRLNIEEAASDNPRDALAGELGVTHEALYRCVSDMEKKELLLRDVGYLRLLTGAP